VVEELASLARVLEFQRPKLMNQPFPPANCVSCDRPFINGRFGSKLYFDGQWGATSRLDEIVGVAQTKSGGNG